MTKLKLIILFLFLLKTSFVYAQEMAIKNIKIEGNKRIPTSFISNIIKDYIGQKITESEINDLTKKLYTSDYFDDILITQKNSTLFVKVTETPIISDYVFQGNELLTEEQLTEIVNIKKRDTFDQKKLNFAVDKIKSEYSKLGKYFTKVKVNKKTLSDSRIKLFLLLKRVN